MKNFLMGVDLGTTNVKAIIYDLEGNPISAGEAGSYRIISPHIAWAEQDGNIWWQDTVKAISQALERFPYDKNDIAAVSVSSQGMGVLPVDINGTPLDNAQIWMDRRCGEEARYIEENFGKDRIMECFGVRSDPYYQGVKIYWLKRNKPEIWSRTHKVLLANSYLSYKLTGVMAIDYIQAIMTMCYDIHRNCWSEPLGDLLGIDFEAVMPKVMKCEEILGSVTHEAAQETGLAEGTTVVVGGVDGAMALIEMGLTHMGDAAEITGTSSNTFIASGVLPPPDSTISFFEPVFATEAVPHLLFAPTNTTGENVRWFRGILGLESDRMPDGTPTYALLNDLAEGAGAGSRGLYYFPYLMGERAPLWNNDVRGMFIGASCSTTRGDMLRAIYEGTSFAQKEIVDEAERVSGSRVRNFRVSGGCARSDIWMRIKASILNVPVQAIISSGGAPKGNAIVAGYGIGIYKDINKTLDDMFFYDKVFEPVPEWVSVYEEMYPLFKSMRDHLLEDLSANARIFR